MVIAGPSTAGPALSGLEPLRLTAPLAAPVPGSGRRSVTGRLFLTVCLVYLLHFASNVVRETYLAVSLGDRLSIRVDEYLGLHPDLFEIPGRGAFINNNPGASMLGAVPYALARPFMAGLFRLRPELVRPKPAARYDDPRPNRTRFFNEARARGLDIKLGLAAAAMHVGLMVPLAGLAAVVMFRFLAVRLRDERTALWLALLYAFGTPIFFRSAFLNQNAIVAHCVLLGFVAMAGTEPSPPTTRRRLLAGALLGLALLTDYSAAPLIAAFGVWATMEGWSRGGVGAGLRAAGEFSLGAAGPLALLFGYQWAAFGHPLLPAQAYMPDTHLSVRGWHGFTLPDPTLLRGNLFDPRYGLLVFCPMLAVALAAPFLRRRPGGPTGPELGFILGASLALYLFNSSVQFALLQFNTGVRYMVPAVPLLFLAVVPVLLRLPRGWTWALVVPTVAISWSVAMARESVPVSLMRIFLGGFELPWLTVLRKTSSAYLPWLERGASPLALFVLAGVVLWLLWRPRTARAD
ncbi:MAG TPA: hypothetical protein VNK43_06495 [Gemmatimonadales bacterium]|nr:hypothetical protein [Gemmatimonadales bacterium]